MADFRSLARAKARKYGLDPNVFVRQIRQESGFNPNARSPAGATGIAQIMPATAKGWGVNPRDPDASLDAAAKNMARYVHQFGSYEKALRAYNAGPGNVDKSKGFAETNNYVRTILGGREPSAAAARASGSSGGSGGGESTTAHILGQTFQTTLPTVDKAAFEQAQRRSVVGQLIAKRNPNSFLLRSGLLTTNAPSLQDFVGSRTLKDVIPGTTVRVPKVSGGSSLGASGGGAQGRIAITGPNPGRIQPQVKNFMGQIASVAGEKVVGSDGTGHSKYTTSGNVSEHYVGAASDIPAAGEHLMKLGRAALIAAGMDPKKARKAPGGLYNIHKNGKRYQIIFGINDRALGGNHMDHLHVGVSRR